MAELRKNVVLDFQLEGPVEPPKLNQGTTLSDAVSVLRFAADIKQRRENIRLKRESSKIADSAFTLFSDVFEQTGDWNKALLAAQRRISKESDPVAIPVVNKEFLQRIDGLRPPSLRAGGGSAPSVQSLFTEALDQDERKMFVNWVASPLAQDMFKGEEGRKTLERVRAKISSGLVKDPEVNRAVSAFLMTDTGRAALTKKTLNTQDKIDARLVSIAAEDINRGIIEQIDGQVRSTIDGIANALPTGKELPQGERERLATEFFSALNEAEGVVRQTYASLRAKAGGNEEAIKRIDASENRVLEYIKTQKEFADRFSQEGIDKLKRFNQFLSEELQFTSAQKAGFLRALRERLGDGFAGVITQIAANTPRIAKAIRESGDLDPESIQELATTMSQLATGDMTMEEFEVAVKDEKKRNALYTGSFTTNMEILRKRDTISDDQEAEKYLSQFVVFAANAVDSDDSKALDEIAKTASSPAFKEYLSKIDQKKQRFVKSAVVRAQAKRIASTDARLLEGVVYDESAKKFVAVDIEQPKAVGSAKEVRLSAGLAIQIDKTNRERKKRAEQLNRLLPALEASIEDSGLFKGIPTRDAALMMIRLEAPQEFIEKTKLPEPKIDIDPETARDAVLEAEPVREIKTRKEAVNRAIENVKETKNALSAARSLVFKLTEDPLKRADALSKLIDLDQEDRLRNMSDEEILRELGINQG
jgi:hypothetical protein